MQVLPFVPAVVFILGLPILIRAFLAFDQLVILERSRYPSAWVADGRPRPFLREMFSNISFIGWLATQKCSLLWLLQTPGWARGDSDALAGLRRLRVCVGIWILVVMPVFAIAVFLSVTLGP